MYNCIAELLFTTEPVGDTCTWYGTEYEGKNLKPCGEKAIGMGVFCNPIHLNCELHSLCERHDREQKVETW